VLQEEGFRERARKNNARFGRSDDVPTQDQLEAGESQLQAGEVILHKLAVCVVFGCNDMQCAKSSAADWNAQYILATLW
jgi:hypothetical protein